MESMVDMESSEATSISRIENTGTYEACLFESRRIMSVKGKEPG